MAEMKPTVDIKPPRTMGKSRKKEIERVCIIPVSHLLSFHSQLTYSLLETAICGNRKRKQTVVRAASAHHATKNN